MSYPLSNVLLDALPEESRKKILPHLSRVAVPIRTSLYEPGESPKYFHFLTSGIASVVVTMADGSTAEVGTLGREGAPQGLHLLGSAGLPTRCFMQIGGTGLRMDFKVFERHFNSDEALRRTMMAYAQYHALMLGQVAGCNRLHEVEPRLARWLLMIRDRTGDSVLRLTQEFLGQMIGSQRTTVGAVAGSLQERGLIDYSRGRIRVLDAVGLENVSCECYQVTRTLLSGVYALARQFIFDELADA
jgi:CRP-like cAMP-binding protein